jgi:glycosyltransferase involved in cell wall biosynthesis
MKMLYLSCHSVLEYDEIKLFREIGVDVFSHGAYLKSKTDDIMRPALDHQDDERLVQLAMATTKENLSPEFLKEFDTIMVMHNPVWIERNWRKFEGKTVIWRTIGQSVSDVEYKLKPYREQGLKIVRYSPMELNIPLYLGEEAFIRFYKDPDEYTNWNGHIKQVITVTQAMRKRGLFCGFDQFMEATDGLPRKLYGNSNQDAGEVWGGFLPFEKLKEAYRDSRAYFYYGTHPASYTLNFIEAFMTGIPIVAVGEKYGNMNYQLGNTMLYEIPKFITNGINGFMSEDLPTMKKYIKQLLDDESLAKEIGQKGREKAISLFGKQKIKEQWTQFFKSIGWSR